jgi:hypothetical protein
VAALGGGARWRRHLVGVSVQGKFFKYGVDERKFIELFITNRTSHIFSPVLNKILFKYLHIYLNRLKTKCLFIFDIEQLFGCRLLGGFT